MPRPARVACVSLPLIATAATLILIIISTFIGQTNKNSSFINSLYFIRLDTRYINAPQELGGPIAGGIGSELGINLSIQNTANLVGVSDFYQAGLFGFCQGKYINATGTWNVQNCSSSSSSFVFNIVDIINSQAKTGKNLTFPSGVNDLFKAVSGLTHAQYSVFIIAIIASAVEFVIGFFGLLSRWGSCVTTIAAIVAFWTLLGASVINVALYAAMSSAFNESFKTFGVHGAINHKVYSLMFIGVFISFVAMVFWTLSTCCCSGRRDQIMRGGGNDRSPVRGYERVSAPYMGGGPPPAQQLGQTHPYGNDKQESYEPMRHTAV